MTRLPFPTRPLTDLDAAVSVAVLFAWIPKQLPEGCVTFRRHGQAITARFREGGSNTHDQEHLLSTLATAEGS